jgi:hypothetical protein
MRHRRARRLGRNTSFRRRVRSMSSLTTLIIGFLES